METTIIGINLIPQEVKEGKTLHNKKWKKFTDQELLVLSDLVLNYDSGLCDRETCDNIVRSLQTEIFERESMTNDNIWKTLDNIQEEERTTTHKSVMQLSLCKRQYLLKYILISYRMRNYLTIKE